MTQRDHFSYNIIISMILCPFTRLQDGYLCTIQSFSIISRGVYFSRQSPFYSARNVNLPAPTDNVVYLGEVHATKGNFHSHNDRWNHHLSRGLGGLGWGTCQERAEGKIATVILYPNGF